MTVTQDKNKKSMGVEYGDAREAVPYMPSIREPEQAESEGIEKGSLLWALEKLREGKKLVGHMTTRYTAWMNEDGDIILNDTHKYSETQWLRDIPSAIAWEIKEDEL